MIDTAPLIIGHLAGDYIFQNDWMAINKKQPSSKGLLACLTHCIIYATCVTMAVAPHTPHLFLAFNIAFWSHLPIDRTGIIDKWMTFFGQTTWATLTKIEDEKIREARRLYVPLIQVATDNAAHLVLMYIAAMLWL